MNKELTKILRKAEDPAKLVLPSETAEIAEYIDRHGAIECRHGKVINARQYRMHILERMYRCVPQIGEDSPIVCEGLDTNITDMKRLQRSMKYIDDGDFIPMKFFNEELMVNYDLMTLKRSGKASQASEHNAEVISDLMSDLNKSNNQIANVFFVDNITQKVRNLDASQVHESITLGRPKLVKV